MNLKHSLPALLIVATAGVVAPAPVSAQISIPNEIVNEASRALQAEVNARMATARVIEAAEQSLERLERAISRTTLTGSAKESALDQLTQARGVLDRARAQQDDRAWREAQRSATEARRIADRAITTLSRDEQRANRDSAAAARAIQTAERAIERFQTTLRGTTLSGDHLQRAQGSLAEAQDLLATARAQQTDRLFREAQRTASQVSRIADRARSTLISQERRVNSAGAATTRAIQTAEQSLERLERAISGSRVVGDHLQRAQSSLAEARDLLARARSQQSNQAFAEAQRTANQVNSLAQRAITQLEQAQQRQNQSPQGTY